MRKAPDGAPAHCGIDHGDRMRQRAEAVKADPNKFGSPAERVCAEHDRQLGGESPLPSLMVAKG